MNMARQPDVGRPEPAQGDGVGANAPALPAHASGRAIDLPAWLGLAAAPTLAAMALLTAVAGGPADICSAASGLGPLAGMPAMYMLMGVFHLGPWLRLASRRA